MSRILLMIGLFCVGSFSLVASDDDHGRFSAYFKNLDLPYQLPRGCSADMPCNVSADFNGDGLPDMAALYQYAGKQSRRNRWNLDLIIIYSQTDSSELTHAIFSHVGQIDIDARVSASLAIQEIGTIKLAVGEMKLERPGINILAAGNTDKSQLPTYYWRNQRFYSIDKSDD